jgi:hypothetical protein
MSQPAKVSPSVVGPLTAALWSQIEGPYRAILTHPFVTGLQDGGLAEEAFRRGAAQGVVGGLIAGWFRLGGRVPAGSCGVLVGPADRGVHRHIPGDQAHRLGHALQPGQDRRPGPSRCQARNNP